MYMPTTPNITQLKQAIAIAERIASLEAQLASLVGGSSPAAAASPVSSAAVARPGRPRGKRTMSPDARARIAAAQRARWAKVKGAPAAPAKVAAAQPAKKRGLSPEGRARIVAALKARWAAKKKAAK